jgi:bifunctional DNA-binding transcriptional regulator/antitoxin component of YhaV-PrlF toxin-antitoxin module
VTVGYSGNPLAKKLGIREGSQVLLIEEPENYQSLLHPLPASVSFANQASQAIDIVHLFATRKEEMQKQLASLRKKLSADASVWVSWPKKSSKLPTNITEDTIREVALPLGFVDIKVCAVSEVWSGLKIVVRKELR